MALVLFPLAAPVILALPLVCIFVYTAACLALLLVGSPLYLASKLLDHSVLSPRKEKCDELENRYNANEGLSQYKSLARTISFLGKSSALDPIDKTDNPEPITLASPIVIPTLIQ